MEPAPARPDPAPDGVDIGTEMQRADQQSTLLEQLSPSGLLAGFADLLRTARQRPASQIGRLAPLAQQHPIAPGIIV